MHAGLSAAIAIIGSELRQRAAVMTDNQQGTLESAGWLPVLQRYFCSATAITDGSSQAAAAAAGA